MGKYGGKLLTIFITPSGVRVCEGENRTGNPDIGKFFVVQGVDEYFSVTTIDNKRRFEITNMSGLVSAIVTECKNRRVNTRHCMIASDCFGIETEVIVTEQANISKNLLTGDVSSLFKKRDKAPKQTTSPDKLMTKKLWGEIARDGSVLKVTTVTKGDKYMLRSLSQEFYSHGYEVIYISGAQETLINFRQSEASSFDCQGKVIFDFDTECRVTVLSKDIPVEMDSLPSVDDDGLYDRLSTLLKNALPTTGRSPLIYLAGSRFANTVMYTEFINQLEAEGYRVFDLFGRPDLPPDYEEQVMAGIRAPEFTPDFATNVALLMSSFSKTLISMPVKVDLSDVLRKNSQVLAKLFLIFSLGAFGVSAGFFASRQINLASIHKNPSNLESLQSEIASLQARQTSLQSTKSTMAQADTTILDLMQFIDDNNKGRVYVVSVDTRDMLPGDDVGVDGATGMSVTTTDSTTGEAATPAASGESIEEVISGSAGGGGVAPVRENIVIRGYAKTGKDAIGYYNKLYNSGLSVKPTLNGVERYELPDGDEVYIFEIEIGEGV